MTARRSLPSKGDAARAAQIFERVIAAAEKSTPSSRRRSYGSKRGTVTRPGALATGQAEAGDAEAAWRTVALIAGYPPQPETWRALGRVEGRRGNVDAALARAPSHERRRAALMIGLAEGPVERADGRQP